MGSTFQSIQTMHLHLWHLKLSLFTTENLQLIGSSQGLPDAQIYLSNEKGGLPLCYFCFGYIGDELLFIYIGIIVNHHTDPY